MEMTNNNTTINTNMTAVDDAALYYSTLYSHARWVLWSYPVTPTNFSSGVHTFALVCLVGSALMLLHSFYMKRWEWKPVRLMADISSFGNMLGGIAYLIAEKHQSNNLANAVFYDFFVCWVSVCLVQVGDLGIFYQRFMAIRGKETGPIKRLMILVWIVVMQFLIWCPAYTFAPFIVNVDDPKFVPFQTYVLEIQMYAYFIYDVYFSLEFGKLLFNHYTGRATYSSRVLIIAIKSMIHCFFSILGNYLFLATGVYGTFCFNCMVAFTLHIIWNVKLEAAFNNFNLSKVSPSSHTGKKHSNSSATSTNAHVSSVPSQGFNRIEIDDGEVEKEEKHVFIGNSAVDLKA